jgi:PAS domain S-box-containing protein
VSPTDLAPESLLWSRGPALMEGMPSKEARFTEQLLAELEAAQRRIVELEARVESQATREAALTDSLLESSEDALQVALVEREERLSRILDAMSDVVFYLAVEAGGVYRFVSVNRAFLTETGLVEDQVCGKRVQEVIPEPAHDLVLGRYAEAIRERRTVRWEEVSVYPAGEKNGQVAVTPVFDEQGCCTHLVGTVRDVTEYRQLEAQVQQTHKLESLGVLAGGIAHDFNNLLVGVLGNADLALNVLPVDSPALPLVRAILKAGQQASGLTNQLLAYSGKGRFVVEELDLNAVVRDIETLLRSSISKKVSLTLAFADGLPAIKADVSQLRQIVLNFITNASEACGEQGGRIEITTESIECEAAFLRSRGIGEELPAGRYVALRVSDDGCGMDAQTRERIFDPFFTTRPKGRGLGLAAVLGIVRGHGGTIWVESEVGAGTTFNVLFPALGHCAQPPVASALVETDWPDSGTVLVVDDVAMVRDLAMHALERFGFTVLCATDGAEAVEVFRDRHSEIDLVLLDLKMPNMDGEEAFECMRAIRDDVPVVLSSGYSEKELTEQFGDKGFAGFLHKPYRLAELKATLNRLLRRPARPDRGPQGP